MGTVFRVAVLMAMVWGCVAGPFGAASHGKEKAERVRYTVHLAAERLPAAPSAGEGAAAATGTVQPLLRGTWWAEVPAPLTTDGRLFVHLYANAFRDDRALAGPVWEEVLGKQRLPGRIDVADVTVDGRPARYAVRGTVLEVAVPRGRPCAVALRFTLHVPRNNGRLSYDAHAVWLGNALPILAVRDAGGWRLDPYYPIGDPFYSEVADYHLQVTVPEGWQVAATGWETLREARDDRRRYAVHAEGVRDMALVLVDSTYRVLEGRTPEGVRVRTWTRQGDRSELPRALHEAAVRSLSFFHRTYSPYPYPDYDVVRTGGFFGGMEYPGLVMVQGAYFGDERARDDGLLVVAHETAHQWWYGIVGNDEVREPWLDESLAQYSTLQFLHSAYPRIARHMERMLYRHARHPQTVAWQRRGLSVRAPVYAFPNWTAYSLLVYERGGAALWELRRQVGEEAMNRALRRYARQHALRTATGADLLRVLEGELGADLDRFFRYWFEGVGGPRPEVKARAPVFMPPGEP
ncbi:M1 family metallopeptidase [Calditerricola satsumensis]|uniref:Peptidase n=1 Tax=Calditerricola satsumensis TaxID=373054 RepID=A0A8J3BB72_9BACI|nr:M1 family metallopeptidase [Calditerricola satsumensis]GGK02254.1 peptidase [Calditerricola satsumensis]